MKEIKLSIPSETEFVGPLVKFFDAFFANKHVDPGLATNVVTALLEALANAIVHGNHTDRAKRVEVLIGIHDRALRIEVHDEGEGFDVDNLPDPLALENLLNPCGRGIFLIRSLMDGVEFHFNGHGTTLRMEKNFPVSLE